MQHRKWRSRRLFCRLLAFSCFAVGTSVNANSLQVGNEWVDQGLSVEARVIETPMLGDEMTVAVSPDGRDLAYTVVKSHVSQNVNEIEFWLRHVANLATLPQPVLLASRSGKSVDARIYPRFSSDGRLLAYLTNAEGGSSTNTVFGVQYDSVAIRTLTTGAVALATVKSIPPDALAADYVVSGIRSYRLSPDGTRVGIVVTGHFNHKVNVGVEMSVDDPYPSDNARSRLAIYDVKNATWNMVSPPSMDVDGFDWAPDGRSIAFSGGSGVLREYRQNIGIYLLNLRTNEVKTLVPAVGTNANPIWSPDSRWIAFQTQKGLARFLARGRLGIYAVNTGIVSYPAYDELGRTSGLSVGTYAGGGMVWSSDSKSILVDAPYQLSKQIFRVSIPDGVLKRFTTDDDHDYKLIQSDSAGRSIFLVRESFVEAPELFVSPFANFVPHRVTRVGGDPFLNDVEVRKLSWPSTDGKWTIHGLLLLPRKEAGDGHTLPVLVYAEGGPTMVSAHFNIGYGYPVHSLLHNGIAVLIPNSRGRPGYGDAFETAWESERDLGRGPLADDLAGLDRLIKDKISNSKRTALAGHSWGGYLAAYALTHTDRFNTVLVHEGGSLDMINESFLHAGSSSGRALFQQLGEGLPFGAAEKERLANLSPIYQADRATTPSLLEYGADSLIQYGSNFFQALKLFDKAPTELINYPRTGHVTDEPALKLDAARRELEWFAFWVLGKPTQRMLEKYGPPLIPEWNGANN